MEKPVLCGPGATMSLIFAGNGTQNSNPICSMYIHVWYIYLHDWVIIRANVGKYTIHGAYGQWNSSPALIFSIEAVRAPKELTRT
jgi:hypothetical protein